MTGVSLAGLDALAGSPPGRGRRVVSILHTNAMHSNLVGVGPLRDYSPLRTGNDATKGSYARLAALIAERRRELEQLGPVLVLDGGDFSMGTAVAAACRELGPDGLGQAIGRPAAPW